MNLPLQIILSIILGFFSCWLIGVIVFVSLFLSHSHGIYTGIEHLRTSLGLTIDDTSKVLHNRVTVEVKRIKDIKDEVNKLKDNE